MAEHTWTWHVVHVEVPTRYTRPASPARRPARCGRSGSRCCVRAAARFESSCRARGSAPRRRRPVWQSPQLVEKPSATWSPGSPRWPGSSPSVAAQAVHRLARTNWRLVMSVWHSVQGMMACRPTSGKLVRRWASTSNSGAQVSRRGSPGTAFRTLPACASWWHPAQPRETGVLRSRVWQLLHLAEACAPCSGKPVRSCAKAAGRSRPGWCGSPGSAFRRRPSAGARAAGGWARAAPAPRRSAPMPRARCRCRAAGRGRPRLAKVGSWHEPLEFAVVEILVAPFAGRRHADVLAHQVGLIHLHVAVDSPRTPRPCASRRGGSS